MPQDDGSTWYIEPKYADDDEGHAPIQYLGYGEPAAPQLPTETAAPIDTPKPLIVVPPGARLLSWLRYLPGKNQLRKDLEQVVADMRAEHFDALQAGDRAEARRALTRGRLAIVGAVCPSWFAIIASAMWKWIGKLGS